MCKQNRAFVGLTRTEVPGFGPLYGHSFPEENTFDLGPVDHRGNLIELPPRIVQVPAGAIGVGIGRRSMVRQCMVFAEDARGWVELYSGAPVPLAEGQYKLELARGSTAATGDLELEWYRDEEAMLRAAARPADLGPGVYVELPALQWNSAGRVNGGPVVALPLPAGAEAGAGYVRIWARATAGAVKWEIRCGGRVHGLDGRTSTHLLDFLTTNRTQKTDGEMLATELFRLQPDNPVDLYPPILDLATVTGPVGDHAAPEFVTGLPAAGYDLRFSFEPLEGATSGLLVFGAQWTAHRPPAMVSGEAAAP